ncbi:glutamate receptor ionotropic, delta-2-like [Palaemon carinicauda]|uniref:glutamate receptor ionotropic, delta-2-like n=1 Tax=Palaemon carinicauda TaxID=392227 RepID=UPI0035B65655
MAGDTRTSDMYMVLAKTHLATLTKDFYSFIRARRACREFVFTDATVKHKPRKLISSNIWGIHLFPDDLVKEIVDRAATENRNLLIKWDMSRKRKSSQDEGPQPKKKSNKPRPQQRQAKLKFPAPATPQTFLLVPQPVVAQLPVFTPAYETQSTTFHPRVPEQHIDLFATSDNKQLPRYVAPLRGTQSGSSGCHVPGLEQMVQNLPVPSTQPSAESPHQAENLSRHSSPSGTQLAMEQLVPPNPGVTTQDNSPARPSSIPASSEVDSLRFIKENHDFLSLAVKKRFGISKKSLDFLKEYKTKSTRRQYKSSWKKWIKRNRLESHLIKWMLILDKKNEDVYAVTNGLRGLIFEGTQVNIIVWNPTGRSTVLSSMPDTQGVTQFFRQTLTSLTGQGKMTVLQDLRDSEELPNSSDMKGRLLTVAAKSILPYFGILDYNADGSIKSASGIDYSILMSLSSFLNFTYRIIGPPDGAFGYPQPDGTITGMIGMAARREIHLAVTGIGANDKRDTVVDFTVPYTQGSLGVYSRAPKIKSSSLAVLTPFTPEVWLCIVIATLTIGLLLWIQSHLLQRISDGDPKWSLQDFSFNVFRSILIQSNLLPSRRWPQRFLFFSWYLFCLIASALYSGTLTAAFAVPAYEKPIDSLLDLPRAVEEGFTLTVTKDSTHEYLFKEAKVGVYKQVWGLFNHKDRSQSFVSSPAAGLKMVLEKKVIHICLEDVAKVVGAGLGRNKFHFSRELFFPQNVVFVVPPGAPYKDSFNRVMLKLIEGGFIDKWEYDEIKKISQKSSGEGEQSRSQVISLRDLQAAFFVILSGYVVAMAVLLIENLFSRY